MARPAIPKQQNATRGHLSSALRVAAILMLGATCSTAATNDAFSAAVDLGQGADVHAAGNLGKATLQSGEVPPYGMRRSIWWKWTAPNDGLFELDNTSPRATLAVYRGESVDSLDKIYPIYDQTTGYDHFWKAQGGHLYYIAALATDRVTTEPIEVANLAVEFDLLFTPPPENDHFANRTDLGDAARVVVDPVLLNAATAEVGEPAHIAGSQALNSRWWSWVAPATGPATVDGGGSHRAIYSGTTLDRLTLIGSDDRDPITFRAEAGTEYHLALDTKQYSETEAGFTIEFEPLPNDDFADAIDLGSVASAEIDGISTFATFEPGEPVVSPGSSSVWWKWTAPDDGRLTLAGDDFVLYQGSSLAGLTVIESTFSNSQSDFFVEA